MHGMLRSHKIHPTIPLHTSFLYFCCINTSLLSYWAHIFFSTGRHGNVRLCIMRKVNDYWHLATKTGTAGGRMNSIRLCCCVCLLICDRYPSNVHAYHLQRRRSERAWAPLARYFPVKQTLWMRPVMLLVGSATCFMPWVSRCSLIATALQQPLAFLTLSVDILFK